MHCVGVCSVASQSLQQGKHLLFLIFFSASLRTMTHTLSFSSFYPVIQNCLIHVVRFLSQAKIRRSLRLGPKFSSFSRSIMSISYIRCISFSNEGRTGYTVLSANLDALRTFDILLDSLVEAPKIMDEGEHAVQYILVSDMSFSSY